MNAVFTSKSHQALCSAGKRHNLRKMLHRRREMSQSAENVVHLTAGICRIVDGKCRNYY